MFTKSSSHKASFWIAGLSFLFLGSAARSQPFQDCGEALAGSGGGISLADAVTTTEAKGVDEWESDIIKIAVFRPGVLVLSGDGPSVQGSLYTGNPAGGSPELEDVGPLGTAHRPLTVVVQPGEHCVQVTPPAGATSILRVRATFFDVCRLGPQDDHGDSFLCATEIGLGEARTGEVSGNDQDVLAFDLTTSSTVSIAFTGGPELSVGLYGEDGTHVTADGGGIYRPGAGRYFVRIVGQGGQEAYELAVTTTP